MNALNTYSQIEDDLEIPHPGISERNFVLFPLLEIAAELDIPGQGRVRELAGRVDPHLGSDEDLRELIDQAHQRNMKII